MEIKISNYIIKDGNPCFVIAEAGVNHNGSFSLAKKMIDAAKEAGADAIKFQTFKSEELVTEKTEMAEYQKKNTGKNETQLQMLKRLELKDEDFVKLKEYCDKKKIVFLSTPHTLSALKLLNPLVPAIKIASADLTNLPLLEKTSLSRKPIILSTGMGTIDEVKNALKAIGHKNVILLQCIASYPCPQEDANVKGLATLRKKFNLLTGYSDHTSGFTASLAAVSLGAVMIEKHFTLDQKMPGPDHKASLSPSGLKEMICQIREVEKALGTGKKTPTVLERRIKAVARKSVVSSVDIPKGTTIKKEMLIIKRPGTGIEPGKIGLLVGKKARREIERDSLIRFSDLS